jgi:hypothetical protein
VGREKGSERGGGRDMSVAAGGAASLPAEEWSTAGQRQWRGALGHGRSERTRGGRNGHGAVDAFVARACGSATPASQSGCGAWWLSR